MKTGSFFAAFAESRTRRVRPVPAMENSGSHLDLSLTKKCDYENVRDYKNITMTKIVTKKIEPE